VTPDEDLIRAEIDAYRAEARAFRAETAAHRAEVRALAGEMVAWRERLEAHLNRQDEDIATIIRTLMEMRGDGGGAQ
jgi:hypothetical protein